MRRTIIACILALGLLATPLALAGAENAEKGRERAAAAKATRDETRALNDTDDEDGNATGGKPAWVESFQARMRELRVAWHENATEIRETCHAAEKPASNASNASKEARKSWAHCIKEGYKLWFEMLRVERSEARAARAA